MCLASMGRLWADGTYCPRIQSPRSNFALCASAGSTATTITAERIGETQVAHPSTGRLPANPQCLCAPRAVEPRKLPCNGIYRTRNSTGKKRLPAYAPEINPVEYMWAQLKTHEIANLIATKAWELSFEATAALRRMRRRSSVILACYAQAELWP